MKSISVSLINYWSKFKTHFSKFGCTMGGPFSVTISYIYVIKMEADVAKPTKPKFYRRFVYDIYPTKERSR